MLSAQPSTTGSSYSFTLDEAIEYALENNYQSINARREVAKAIKKKWETTATGLPQINANVDYQNRLKQPVSLLPGEVVGGEPGTFVPVVFGTEQQLGLTATLSQLIFDGSYLVGLQAAKTFLNYTHNLEEKAKLEIRKGVINAYGSVLLANESVLILKNNKEALEKNLHETLKIFENGLAEEEDVEQLQITLAQITNQLSNADRLAKIALEMLNLSLGIDINSNVTLTDDLESLVMQNIDINFTKQAFNIENNIDYKIAYTFTEQRHLELKLEKSRALPSINAFVNYGTIAYDNEFVFFDSDTRWFQSSILGVGINIPIFSSLGRSAKTQQARIALDQANTEFLETQQKINLELNRAKSDYQFAIENYETSKKNLTLAERIEKKNQIKYSEGLATSFEFRQAQLQLYSSQQEVLQAMLDIINKRAALEIILNIPNQ
ncbi:TolC family protein [Aquimarina sp. TRL1]|nr:TolC family protein [Aquimarina sp. TRL1]